MEAHHPSTLLSMDSIASSHDESDLEMNHQTIPSRPPDINLPLSAERSPPPQHTWNPDPCDILDVGLGTQVYETETFLNIPKAGQKMCQKGWQHMGCLAFLQLLLQTHIEREDKGQDC